MKRLITAICTGAMALSLLGGCADSAAGGEAVTVEPVSAIAATGYAGLMDRYAGMVVAGETAQVQRDSSKTILETYVEEGDLVQVGDVLFEYDTEAIQLDLDKLYLEKESLENSITAANAAIDELDSERSKAKDSEKLSYTLQIDSKRADIREAEYNIGLKDRDIAAMEASLVNAEVLAPIAGRIMSVDEEGSGGNNYYYGYGEDTGNNVNYITVTDVARLRVEGNISEMNAFALTEGLEMTVRSRIDNSQTWSGVLSMIDWEHPVDNSNNNNGGMVYVGGGESDSEMTIASKYPFYIELTDTEGLMLGQHVYIEPDQGDSEDTPAGPMIPSYYICYDDDGDTYVWAADSRDKLEKRSVTLGVYDEMMDCYEIADGLTVTDYIAFPMEDLEAGRPVERYEAPEAGEDMVDDMFPMG